MEIFSFFIILSVFTIIMTVVQDYLIYKSPYWYALFAFVWFVLMMLCLCLIPGLFQ
nr:MAG TPA: hypothetical protein [Caudoviricetes sp.]